MNLNRLSLQQLIIIDMACAFAGAILYLFLFDFLHQSIGLPYWVVQAQLVANFSYGVFGVLIYLSGERRLSLFRYLITMNMIYAGLCLVLAVLILTGMTPLEMSLLGACLLLIEGVFIFALAIFERRSLSRE